MSKNVPVLRFPGFEGEWKENKLGNIASFSKGKGLSKADIDPDGSLKCIRYGELYTNYNEQIKNVLSKTSIDKNNLNLSEAFDLIIPASGETAIDLATASCVLESDIALGGDINIIRTKLDNIFLAYYLNNKKKYDIAKLAQGSSVIHLYSNHLSILKILHPTINEQNKIASFLSSVDLKIELLTKKKELMEQYKKGIMQKIFSQEIRFKDENGNNYPDWEKRKIGDICTLTPRKIQKPKKGYWRLGLRSHAKGTFHEYVKDPSKNSMTELFVVKNNDLIVNITFAWEHAIAIASQDDENKLVSHRFPTYSFNDYAIPNFMYYVVTQKIFKKKMDDISPGGAGRNRVMSKKDFPLIKVFIPHISEQKKITYFLSLIDSKISVIDKELSSVKEFKKGLLQKMFV